MHLREKPGADKRPNRHPVDQLAELRDAIKNLQAREAMLRRQLIETGNLEGAEWEAQIVNRTQHRLDRVALVRAFGRERLQPFLKPLEYEQVYLKRRGTRGD